MGKLLVASILALGGMIGIVGNAAAMDADDVALCVGCTNSMQFEAAAEQAVGTAFNGERLVLVVNPDTGMSKWVMVFNTPPGQGPLAIQSPTIVQRGVAVPLDSDPLAIFSLRMETRRM